MFNIKSKLKKAVMKNEDQRYFLVYQNQENEVKLNTIDRFKNRTTSNLALSISTKVYGILPFKVGSFQSIRHVVTPMI